MFPNERKLQSPRPMFMRFDGNTRMTVQQQDWLTNLIRAPEARRFGRTLTGCVLSYGAARLAGLPEGYWALITTMIVVTQPSLTQAITTARDQIIGACIGGIVGGIGLVVMDRGIEPLTPISLARPLYAHPALGLEGYRLPNTERIAREFVYLPVFPEMTDEQVDFVAQSIREHYRDARVA